MKLGATFGVLALLCGAASASATILISGGPTYTPPGGGSCTVSGAPDLLTGATLTCSGLNLSATRHLYYGIKNNASVVGDAMDNVTPAGTAIFLYSSSGSNSLTFTGTTRIYNVLTSAYQSVSTRNIVTFTGTGSLVSDARTEALNNSNGDVESLWQVGATSFTVGVNVQAYNGSTWGTSGPYFDGIHTRDGTDKEIDRVDMGFYYDACGDGIVTGDEQCDQGAANGTSGSCCDANCQFVPASTVCRAVAGLCDVAETCTGSSATCPTDAFVSSGTVCRAAAGVCDVAEACTGSSAACPADAKQPQGTVCRPVAGVCDVAESCDGTSNNCPTDQFLPSSTVCRASQGECDLQENCTGGSASCPPDARKSAGTACTDDGNPCTLDQCDGTDVTCQHPAGNLGAICHQPVSPCDATETCTGTSSTCPPDGLEPSSTVCRPSLGDCDPAENCTGTSLDCPNDVRSPSQTPCTDDGNPCTLDECDGTDAACQHPAGNPGAVCRPAAGECDVAEVCDGTSTACPADQFLSQGTSCTDDGNPCTLDQCDGQSAACTHPAGNEGTLCRASAGECDIAEVCDGINTACPADAVEPSGTACTDDGSPCTLDECDGTDVTCQHPAGNAGTVCRPEAGDCDVSATCDGTSSTCPPNTFLPSGTVCRPVAGECDIAESCTGTSATCPTDLFVAAGTSCTSDGNPCTLDQCDGSSAPCQHPAGNAGTVCRAAAGDCDTAGTCTGTSSTCPADVLLPASTVCRAAAGDCDTAGTCTGTSSACPADVLLPASTVCRPAASECDAPENCTGSSATCPPDVFKPDGTRCNGTNDNPCLNDCQSGVCVDDIAPNCCGNGTLDVGEQCDDGNVTDGDICPSSSTSHCRYDTSHSLIRGSTKKPSTDKVDCQVEWYVQNPNNPAPSKTLIKYGGKDKYGLPIQIQSCQDQDATCDLNLATVGRCQFQIVACVNNSDPDIPACVPNGVNSITVQSPSKSIANTAIIGPLQLANIARVKDALNHLLDPNDPAAGYSKAPPLVSTQRGFCTAPIAIDVIAPSTTREKAKAVQNIVTKSLGGFPKAVKQTSKLVLKCLPRSARSGIRS